MQPHEETELKVEDIGSRTILTVRTSEPGWMTRLARAYRNREKALIVDDAEVGIALRRFCLRVGFHVAAPLLILFLTNDRAFTSHT